MGLILESFGPIDAAHDRLPHHPRSANELRVVRLPSRSRCHAQTGFDLIDTV